MRRALCEDRYIQVENLDLRSVDHAVAELKH